MWYIIIVSVVALVLLPISLRKPRKRNRTVAYIVTGRGLIRREY